LYGGFLYGGFLYAGLSYGCLCALWVHVPGLGVEVQVGSVAGEGPGAGVGVTDPEERVALPLDQVVGGDAGPVMGGRVEERPAGGVPAEGGGVGGRCWYGSYVDDERVRRVERSGGLGGLGGLGGAVRIDLGAEEVRPRGVRAGDAAGADEGALGAEDAGEGVHHDDGADLVGRVQPHELPGGPFGMPVPLSESQDLPHEGVPAPPQADVEEPGSGDDDVADAVAPREALPEDLGDPQRRLPGGAGELKGDVGGVVTTATGPRRGDLGPPRHDHVQLPVIDSTTHRAQHGTGELDGGHGTSVGEEGGG
jgi:hypothetical protein